MTAVLGRFAPSPSGRMHLGNVFSALLAWLSAKSQGGKLLLRIEDLDPARSRKAYADAILDDLDWLGLPWDLRAENQSLRTAAYAAAFAQLELYPCYCTRDQLHAASAPHGPDGTPVYPGTCRGLTPAQRAAQTKTPCWRIMVPDETVTFLDGLQGPQSVNLRQACGDFIVRRSDGVYAYQLAVVTDDAAAGVTEVVRGRDLLFAVPMQLYLYRKLSLRPPVYFHVPMLLAPDGRRLSKREKAMDLGYLRAHYTAEHLLGFLAWRCGLLPRWEDCSAEELVPLFSWEKVTNTDIQVDLQKAF